MAVTVDDGYRNFLLHGHPIFRRARIPVTVYVVGQFSDGRLWLWWDQIEFGLEHTARRFIRVEAEGMEPLDLDLSSPSAKASAFWQLTEALKYSPATGSVNSRSGSDRCAAWRSLQSPRHIVPP